MGWKGGSTGLCSSISRRLANIHGEIVHTLIWDTKRLSGTGYCGRALGSGMASTFGHNWREEALRRKSLQVWEVEIAAASVFIWWTQFLGGKGARCSFYISKITFSPVSFCCSIYAAKIFNVAWGINCKCQLASLYFRQRSHLQRLDKCVRIEPVRREKLIIWHPRRHYRIIRNMCFFKFRTSIWFLYEYMGLTTACGNKHTADRSSIPGTIHVLTKLDAFIASAFESFRGNGKGSIGEHRKKVY